MNELYKAGWNQRITNPSAKLPRDSKKTEQFLAGYYACNKFISNEIAQAILECRNPVAPALL